MHVERGAHRALLLVLVGYRGAEQGHHAVPDELVDEAAPAGDAVRQTLQAPGHQPPHLLGIHPLGQLSEAGEVGEED